MFGTTAARHDLALAAAGLDVVEDRCCWAAGDERADHRLASRWIAHREAAGEGFRPSTTWSKMLRWTTARVGAVQIWPEWNAQVDPMAVTADLRSASSKTTAAPLPPSSISNRFMVGAPAAAMCWPTRWTR